MQALYHKLRKYEIRIRKAIKSQMQGDFHSVFKGSGLEFDDVRDYQYGDDTRYIDWNVTAKGHGTFIKTFKEEKEQTVYFVIDLSASQQIGKKNNKKIDIAREIVGVLALSALHENSQVSVMGFTDERELYVKPGKGIKHGYFIIHQLFNFVPQSPKTNINAAIRQALSHIKKRSVVVLVSDFIDEVFHDSLKAMAHKHDLVAIQVADPRELSFPSLGIIPLYDNEKKKTIWMNTSSRYFRKNLSGSFHDQKETMEVFCKRNNASYLSVNTSEDFVAKLIKLFKVRNKSRSSSVQITS